MRRRYVDYLLDALHKRELFRMLPLTPKQFWHTLLFRDRYNYFGIKAHLPEDLSQQLKSQPGALTQAPPLPPQPTYMKTSGIQDSMYAVYWHFDTRLNPSSGLSPDSHQQLF
jgi:hypothetical protein